MMIANLSREKLQFSRASLGNSCEARQCLKRVDVEELASLFSLILLYPQNLLIGNIAVL